MEGEGTKAPGSPDYFSLSEYPPGTDIEYELTWDGYRVVGKVPRWAHEKWLLKYHPDGTKRTCEDRPNSASATADAASSSGKHSFGWVVKGTKDLKSPCEDLVKNPSATAAATGSGKHSVGWVVEGIKALKLPCEDLVENSSATAAAYGGKRPCEDHTSAAASSSGSKDLKCPCEDHTSATDSSSVTRALKHHWKDSVEIPSETAAAYAEVIRSNPELAYTYPDVYAYHKYPGRYGSFVEGGRVVYKLDKWAGYRKPRIRSTSKVEGGFYLPKPLKEDPLAAGAKVENHVLRSLRETLNYQSKPSLPAVANI